MIRQKLYVCHCIDTKKVGRVDKPQFAQPQVYKLVIAPVNGSTDIAMYGERVFKMFRASINSNLSAQFKEGDKIYYGIEPPMEEREVEDLENGTIEIVRGYSEPFGSGANYKVISVRPQNVKTMIYFEMLP